MKWLQVGAALLFVYLPSYAGAQTPEGFLGDPAKRSGPAAKNAGAARSVSPAGRATVESGGAGVRYSTVLGGLRPEGRATTRGAKDTKIYQAASPAVVLVVTKDSLGSGALISPDGRIVTNLHVVGKADEVGVVFKPATEGAEIKDADLRVAKVVRRDALTDLALLQVGEVPAGVTPLAIGSAAQVQVGSDVHAIGHPTGQAWTYTRGIVSQIRQDYAWATESRIKHKATVIQTQTPINPGNSGGPLIDDELRIIGINSFSSDGEGINFAVSADDVKALLVMTSDRGSEPVEKADETCKEEKELDSRRTKDDDGDEFLVDADCDGEADYVHILPDDKKEPALMLFVSDGSDVVDVVVVDKKRDGEPDLMLIDSDRNGKVDMEGYYRKGEYEPYRYERVKE